MQLPERNALQKFTTSLLCVKDSVQKCSTSQCYKNEKEWKPAGVQSNDFLLMLLEHREEADVTDGVGNVI